MGGWICAGSWGGRLIGSEDLHVCLWGLRNGWAATIVDTLTTMALMGLEEEFKLELNYTINQINFKRAKELVDPFETTIR